MAKLTFGELVEAKVPVEQLTAHIIHELAVFNLGTTVDFNFLSRMSVGAYCKGLGFSGRRNWSKLTLDEIAPTSKQGPHVVPEREAVAVLEQLRYAIDEGLLKPKDDGDHQPQVISDFLPVGKTYKRKRTLGHLWEFQYALAVELEHGKTRGANVTNNHPLLTALVVIAHLSEDALYYARLWDMETAGELFNALCDGEPVGDIMEEHIHARAYLQSRLQERLKNAKA